MYSECILWAPPCLQGLLLARETWVTNSHDGVGGRAMMGEAQEAICPAWGSGGRFRRQEGQKGKQKAVWEPEGASGGGGAEPGHEGQVDSRLRKLLGK